MEKKPKAYEIADMRQEFWSLPNEALVDRDTAGAVLYLGRESMEAYAIKGGGPRYMKIGRRALYRKSDVLAWIDERAQMVENTAQLERGK